MLLGMTSVELLIISFFVITMINCAITYVFCSKCLTIFEEEKALNKAVKKLRMYDQYILSKINLIIGVFYFVYVYFILMEMMDSNSYIFFFSCIFSFGLTLVTTFVSRLCYCYTGNVLLETKLNEFECFLVNLKSLILLYLPFVVISALVPSVYMLDIDYYWRNVLFAVGLTIVLTLLT